MRKQGRSFRPSCRRAVQKPQRGRPARCGQGDIRRDGNPARQKEVRRRRPRELCGRNGRGIRPRARRGGQTGACACAQSVGRAAARAFRNGADLIRNQVARGGGALPSGGERGLRGHLPHSGRRGRCAERFREKDQGSGRRRGRYLEGSVRRGEERIFGMERSVRRRRAYGAYARAECRLCGQTVRNRGEAGRRVRRAETRGRRNDVCRPRIFRRGACADVRFQGAFQGGVRGRIPGRQPRAGVHHKLPAAR